MSTAVDSHDSHDSHDSPDSSHGDGQTEHHPDSFFVRIFIFLVIVTGLEVMLKYVSIGSLFLPVLFVLMAIKFVTVVLYFMHLKFDSKWFNMVFWGGLGLAIGVYVVALTTFKFWSS